MGTIQVISALKDLTDPLTLLELSKRVDCSNDTMRSAVEVLLKIGVVQQKIEKGPPPRRLISLTEKGKKVAELLEQIEEVLES